MRKARFTEEQIIGILKEHDGGAKAGDLFPAILGLDPTYLTPR
jgi:hypothetical protein